MKKYIFMLKRLVLMISLALKGLVSLDVVDGALKLGLSFECYLDYSTLKSIELIC